MTAVIFDWNRTLYDPDSGGPIRGAIKVISTLKDRGARLLMLSRQEEGRSDIIEQFGFAAFFIRTFFVREKTERLFRDIGQMFGPPHEIYVVGDYLREEIRFGNRAGMKTIWFKNGKFANFEPQIHADTPNHTVVNLTDVLEIIP